MRSSTSFASAAVIGLAADRLLGEPPAVAHPVVWFGNAMTRFEQRRYGDSVRAGTAHTLAGVGLAAAAGVALERSIGRWPACAVATWVCAAGRMLEQETKAVAAALISDDVVAAREQLSRLVGRATDELDEADMARAAVETLAENTVDAVIATLLWAAIGGAPAALAHRAINTMDAMVGHRSTRYERYGRASARSDDVANLVPARLAMLGTLCARPRRAGEIVRTVRRDAPQHPSPNGGPIEAAFAAALDVSLGGTNRYGDRVEYRGRLGTGREPVGSDIHRAATLARHCAVVICLTALTLDLAIRSRQRWSRP